MQEPLDQITQVEDLLDRLREGDDSAREKLIAHASERLRHHAHKMLNGDQLHRWTETDDVHNRALLRLHQALETVRPESAKHFFNLGALQIHRELKDMARHYLGEEGVGAHYLTDGICADAGRPRHEAEQTTHDPAKLFDWTVFHEKVDQLPERELEVFNFHFYQGLPLVRIAERWGMSPETVERAWQSAASMLRKAMCGVAPGS